MTSVTARFEILGACLPTVPNSTRSIPVPSEITPRVLRIRGVPSQRGLRGRRVAGDLSGSMIAYGLEATRLTDRVPEGELDRCPLETPARTIRLGSSPDRARPSDHGR
jgi:hypothetical protein